MFLTCIYTFIMNSQKIKVTTAGLSAIEAGTTHIPCLGYLEKCRGIYMHYTRSYELLVLSKLQDHGSAGN